MSCLDKETVVEFIQFMRNDWSKIIQPTDILDATEFKKIEEKMNLLIQPSKGSKVKKVDTANIIVQRLINKIMIIDTELSKKNIGNIQSFFKLDCIPLDMKVAAGRDILNYTLKDGENKVTKKNKKSITKYSK